MINPGCRKIWFFRDSELNSGPYIAMWTAQQTWQPGWLTSQPDMLADDWMVA
ncbi:MAG: DUF2829 domain-containing protein [bacterium]|nr:DUF2829 domain-containing protein [bacterium]